MSDDLVKRLTIKAGVMEMGEKIAWGSDTSLMREAADRIEELEAELAKTQKLLSFSAECLLTLGAYTKGETPYTAATLGKGEDTLSIRFREGRIKDE